MNSAGAEQRWARSVGAVVAGMAAAILLTLGADEGLRAMGLFPPLGQTMADAMFLLAAAHRSVFGALGSYLAARLAPGRPMMHALVLGGLGLVANTAGLAVAWNAGPSMGPLWYPLALVALSMPNAWVGGWFGQRREKAGSGTKTGV